ncbi:MAG: M1 family metallopeptidase [Caulobacteraceae bacterium]
MTITSRGRSVCRFLALMFASVVIVGPLPANAQGAGADERVMLPSAVTPEHYRIDIVPDARALTFRGKVQIDVVVHRPTAEIVLNTADIVIDKAALFGEAAAPTVRYDGSAQTATFAFGHPLAPGPHTLSVAYHGKIYQQASGLFALDYDAAGAKKRALFTQFENSDARRFVPSWDEPGRKATFQLTVAVPANEMALSNMPVARTEPLPGGMKRVSFAETPKMSSYLLFFGAGDFERVHRDVGGVDVGVVVKRGDTASASFALDAAAHILPYYNDYFGTPYPLPKLDLIAGPGSSQVFGAMENWGAIFYFERDLLIDPRISTQADKQGVYITVAHEMAHQWFGDLVTMAWWDDLWLNEGFASWMELKVTDNFHPEWKVWLQSLGEKQAAMQEDARDGTHPIITPIRDVNQAAGAFDDITYLKGAAVIRMLESYMGEADFRAGVRRYMRDHAYGNTVTDDLWRELDQGSAKPITDIAHDFTLQAGVPMITETGAACAGGATSLALTQGHYAIDSASTTATVWRVPVTAQSLGAPPAKAVVSGGVPTPLAAPGCGAAVLNAGQTAYFRSRYSGDGLRAITARYGDLTADDQLGLLNDTGSLALAGEAPMSDFLGLTPTFKSLRTDPVVVIALAGRLRGLDELYRGLPTQSAFRLYARSLLQPTLHRVGWTTTPGESDNTALLRGAVIRALGDLDDPEVLGWARERFAGFIADPASLDAASRRTVLGIVAVHADAASWDQLHALARAAKTELERNELYEYLAAAESPALAQRALDLSLSDEVAKTTAPGMIAGVSDWRPGMAFDFAVQNWARVAALIEPGAQARFMPRLVGGGAFDTDLIAKLDAFADRHIAAGDRQDVRKAEAEIRYYAKVRAERLPQVDAWLKTHGG